MRIAILTLLSLVAGGGVAAAPVQRQSSVAIPLSGTLPLSCSARVLAVEAPGSARDRLTVEITHDCNAEHILQFTAPGLDAALAGASAQFSLDGGAPYQRGPDSVAFLEAVTRARPRRLTIRTDRAVDFGTLTAPGAFTITMVPR